MRRRPGRGCVQHGVPEPDRGHPDCLELRKFGWRDASLQAHDERQVPAIRIQCE